MRNGQPGAKVVRGLSLGWLALQLLGAAPETFAEPVDGFWDPATELTSIDIIVLYTPAAAAAQGDEEALKQDILKVVGNANRSLTNSRVGVCLNPVYIGKLNGFVETGSIMSDWDVIAGITGDLRGRNLREDYKADLVYLVVEPESFGYQGGAGWPGPGGDASTGYSVMRRTVMAGVARFGEYGGITFIHETGHLLGAGHDIEHGYPSPLFQPSPAAFTYANGHRFQIDGVTYRDVMAYDPGIQVALFSNPNQTFLGVPTGIAAGQPGEADAAQTLNRLGPLVAKYRTALSRIGFAEPIYDVGEGEGSVIVRLRREGDLNTSTRVTVNFDRASPAKADMDYTRPAIIIVAFATNQQVAEMAIPILPDTLAEGDETLQLTLSTVQGNHGLSSNSQGLVIIHDDEDAFNITPAKVSIPETGGVTELDVAFTGSLGPGEIKEFDLSLGPAGDTATPGIDVQISTNRLSFDARVRHQRVRVTALPDGTAEADETLRLNIGKAAATIRVLDDDRPGALLPTAEANDTIGALAALPGGGVLVAGAFTEIQGVRRTGVARLQADGSLDATFNPPSLTSAREESPMVPPARINCLTRIAGNRWLVGGYVGLANGQPAANLICLKDTGEIDPEFRHPGFDGGVWAALELNDGKLLIAGAFDHVGGQNLRGFVRLNANGSLDSTFKLAPGLDGSVAIGASLAKLPDGRILLGGQFEKFNGEVAKDLIRLNPDGTMDQTFPLLASGASALVTSLAVLPDGTTYAAGFFEQIGGRGYQRLARLKPDGSFDSTFRAPNPNGEVYQVLPLPNRQLVVVGTFTVIANTPRRFVALLNSDGTVDNTFDLGQGAGDHVWAVSAGADGSLYLGGILKSFNEQPASRLARLRLPPIPGRFLGTSLVPDGTWRTRVWGWPGARYEMQGSLDFRDWKPVAEVRIDNLNDTSTFSVPATRQSGFYRFKEIGQGR